MALVKYKNPVVYGFQIWMANHPESTHPLDRERFLEFAKNVCRYNAKRWKDVDFLEKQILEVKPTFDPDRLEQILIAFEYLVDFHGTNALPNVWRDEDTTIESGHYYERGYKNGQFYEETKQIPR